MKALTFALLLATSASAQTIPQHQVNALFGARGQIPSGSNPFVCDKDPRIDASTGSGTVGVKWDGTRVGQPAVINFTGDVSITMSGATANISFSAGRGGGGGGGGGSSPSYAQILGGVQHLVVACTSNSTVTISADWMDVQGNATTKGLHPVALTAVITNSGAGGLDVGTVQPNTWYQVWTGAFIDGSSPAAFFSTAGPPSGLSYKLWRQVDWVRTDSSSHIEPFLTVGTSHVFSKQYTFTSSGTSGLFSPQNAASEAPPMSTGLIHCIAYGQSLGGSRDVFFRAYGYTSMSILQKMFNDAVPISIPLSYQFFDMKWTSPGGGAAITVWPQAFDTML